MDKERFLKLLQERDSKLQRDIELYEGLDSKDCIELVKQYHAQRYELLYIISLVNKEL